MLVETLLILLTPNTGTSSHVCQATISLRSIEILKTVYQAHDDGPLRLLGLKVVLDTICGISCNFAGIVLGLVCGIKEDG
jgi:hypothetical protein